MPGLPVCTDKRKVVIVMKMINYDDDDDYDDNYDE